MRYVQLYNILPHYLVNGTIFEKNIIEQKMCCLIFSTTFVWNISHYKKNSAKYDKNCTLLFTYSTCYSWEILNELEFPGQILEK